MPDAAAPTLEEPAEGALGRLQWLPSVRLQVLAALFRRLSERRYEDLFGLSFLDHRIIGAIAALGEASFKRVCQEAKLDKSHASRLVSLLADRGLLEKSPDPADQRSVLLRLTEEGRRQHAALQRTAADLNGRWISALSAEQRETFMDCLRLLTERAQAMAEETDPPAAPLAGPATARPDEVAIDADAARRLYELLGSALAGR